MKDHGIIPNDTDKYYKDLKIPQYLAPMRPKHSHIYNLKFDQLRFHDLKQYQLLVPDALDSNE